MSTKITAKIRRKKDQQPGTQVKTGKTKSHGPQQKDVDAGLLKKRSASEADIGTQDDKDSIVGDQSPQKKRQTGKRTWSSNRGKIDIDRSKKLKLDDLKGAKQELVKFTFRLNPDVEKKVDDRKNAIEGKTAPADPLLKDLWNVYQKGKEVETKFGQYQTDLVDLKKTQDYKKKGAAGQKKDRDALIEKLGLKESDRTVDIDSNGIKINVLLDMGTSTINARVSLEGEKGKGLSTAQLSKLAEEYGVTEQQEFLDGIQGKKRDGDPGEAYKRGIETRYVALLSDIMHNPGSSALTERLLDNITGIGDIKRLFTGPGNEHSYGALPSQNQTTNFDKDDHDRTTAFLFSEDLLSEGGVYTSAAKSNMPQLRKLQSMLHYDNDLFTVSGAITEKRGEPAKQQAIDGADFMSYIQPLAAKDRELKAREAELRDALLISEGEMSDDEDQKITLLTPEERQVRQRRAQKIREASGKKLRALSRKDDPSPSKDSEQLEFNLKQEFLKADLTQVNKLTFDEQTQLMALFQKMKSQKVEESDDEMDDDDEVVEEDDDDDDDDEEELGDDDEE